MLPVPLNATNFMRKHIFSLTSYQNAPRLKRDMIKMICINRVSHYTLPTSKYVFVVAEILKQYH